MPQPKSVPATLVTSIALAILALLSPTPLPAQLPIARISYLFPPGGKAGSTVEVTVVGTDLDDASGLSFSHGGIKATARAEAGRFTVTIASNTPPGVYEVRFVGRFGLSNPRAFLVDTLPEANAPATNTAPANAFPVAVDSVINGQTTANAVSWFRFSAKKAQRLFIECDAETIDSRLDPVLAVLDASGRELERTRTTGLLDFTAPADGSFLLKVHDFLYRGGDGFLYRATLSTGPRLDYIHPPAGLAGTKTNYVLYGRNLPGGKPAKGLSADGKPLEQLTVEIALPGGEQARQLNTGLLIRSSEAAVDGFEYRLKTSKGSSNPFMLGFAIAPVIPEQEPNNKPSQAQRISPPCEVAGSFQPAGDQDWFSFQAKKGEVYWIEVFSQRLGLPTDPFLVVQRVTRNDKGEDQFADVLELADIDTNLGEREFNTASRDPYGRFEVKEDGTYVVLVRDLFQQAERGVRNYYRLCVRRETPDFHLVAYTVAPKPKADAKNLDIGVPFLRRGETIAIRVLAFRQDGFNGDIQLALDQPPPGLIFAGDRLEGDRSSDFILLTASDDAPAFAGPIKLIGRAKIGDKDIVRVARGGTMIFPVGNVDTERARSRLAREFTLAITDKESAPVSLVPAEKKTWEAAANAKLQIPLKITRRGEFNANFKLKPLGPGNQEALKEFEVDGKATNTALNLDLAALKLAPGTYVFSAQTQIAGKYRNNPEAAAFAEASSKEAAQIASDLEAGVKTAAETLGAADKLAKDSAAAAKTATDKLTAARNALEKMPTDEKLAAERTAAEKAVMEFTASAKAAEDARAAAWQSKATADTRAKEANARRDAAAARAKEAVERAKPRDATVAVLAAPIFVKVTAVEQAKSK